MSTSKHIDKICAVAVVLALLLTILLANGEALGIQAADRVMGYETRLFDTSRVHTLDIEIDDWDSFIEGCEDEEYTSCAVVIDNEAYKNVALRAKGNTSLSSVSQLGSQRYSFKIEFDHYDSTKSYHGLDKLSLNNLIQDNTMMKDYLTYQMMNAFGVDAPLCSFVYITVNGEDWGLYLAVEGVEDAFLQRNYGSESGDLYKPDSMSMGGGGPGNGKDFNMDDFSDQFGGQSPADIMEEIQSALPDDFDPQTWMQENGGMPDSDAIVELLQEAGLDDIAEQLSDMDFGDMGGGGGGFDGGMGSDDAKLQYIDDDPDSYSTIFDSAKTDVTEADQTRLIAALKALSEGDVESCLDMDEVLRYFVVHNYVVNGDSYTGSMIHNYYLHEADGKLSMIPWDYNLAFGGFQSSSATSTVNDPIDTPLSVTGDGSRPMVDWIFQSEEYTELYHQYFQEFLDTVDIQGIIENAAALIDPYVEKDPTKFCTYEEFETGIETLKTFCELRSESVAGQLDGTIPSTTDGQRTDAALVDASSITISDMGSMNSTMGGGMGGDPGGMGGDPGSMGGDPGSMGGDPGSMGGGFGGDMGGFGGGDHGDMGGGRGGKGDHQSQQPDSGEMSAIDTVSQATPTQDGGSTEAASSGENGGEEQAQLVTGDSAPTAPTTDETAQQAQNSDQPSKGGGQMMQMPGEAAGPSDSGQEDGQLTQLPTDSEQPETPADDTAEPADDDTGPQADGGSEEAQPPQQPDSGGSGGADEQQPQGGGDQQMGGHMPGDAADQGQSAAEYLILLGASVAVLAIGLAIAILYKRKH